MLRRISQLLCLLIFLILFMRTDYNGSDSLDGAVNLIFRIDPFVAACAMLATRTFITLLAPALLLVLLALAFGRLFCGWACPMGSLLDIFRRLSGFRSGKRENTTLFPGLPSWLLFMTLVAAFFGFPLAGYIDPFSLLVRAMTQAIYPLFNSVTVGFFTFTYNHLSPAMNSITEPVYGILRETVLPAEQKYFQQVYLAFFLLAVLFVMEQFQPRFFCRNLCPLGAMQGILGRWSWLKGIGGDDACGACHLCSQICRMGAVDSNRAIAMDTCTFCNECVTRCPRQVIHFQLSAKPVAVADYSGSRRGFLGALGVGLLLPWLRSTTTLARQTDSELIRPPGACQEKEFLSRCVRCGECLQVCITNGLQPALFEAGLEGIFSPHLVSRLGYCEYNCTLCGQVCPTGAIKSLALADKQQVRIGIAELDRNRCLPFAKGIPCMVCEEHCPVSEKAIRFAMVSWKGLNGETALVKQPWVVEDLCIGCGICENRCPLPGPSAIVIRRFLPAHQGSGYADSSYG